MTQNYEDRLRRVVQYIHDNPAGDLSLDKLADVAALSRFHWHRIFHAMMGETCAHAVRRIRAHRAAFWLLDSSEPVARIAARAGYDNEQSFARIFREFYGQTPAAFRVAGTLPCFSITFKTGETTMYNVDIKELPEARLAGLSHKGPYHEISRSYEQVTAIFGARGLWPQSRGMVAVFYDDPTAVAPSELRSLAGISVMPSVELPRDLEERMLPAGRHAVLRLKGPYTGLQAAYNFLYGQWFAASGEEPGDGPSFEMYLNSPMDTAPAELLTDICAPLRS
ncbi:MAG: GyrI-like domain-containing protein [Sedimentitalea sp.]